MALYGSYGLNCHDHVLDVVTHYDLLPTMFFLSPITHPALGIGLRFN
jgi:hypothetical protein